MGAKMVIGVGVVELHLPANRSLKGKRQALNRITERVRSRFPVSIAEVGHQDLWQRARLGFCRVSSDAGYAGSCLDKVVNFIDSLGVAEMLDCVVEVQHFDDEDAESRRALGAADAMAGGAHR